MAMPAMATPTPIPAWARVDKGPEFVGVVAEFVDTGELIDVVAEIVENVEFIDHVAEFVDNVAAFNSRGADGGVK